MSDMVDIYLDYGKGRAQHILAPLCPCISEPVGTLEGLWGC